MKKTILISILIISFVFMGLSCQKAKEPETQKEVRTMKGEVAQLPTEKTIAIPSSPLTEDEQKFIEKIGVGPLVTPDAFKSKDEAKRYLKILLKGNHRNVRFFHDYFPEKVFPDEEKARHEYGIAIGSALSVINAKTNKEEFNLVVEVLKTKTDYPEAMSEAANILKFGQDKSVIPLLREVTKHSNPTVRLEAASSLLALGDADTALPVLDELIKEGATSALGYIFHGMEGKEWKDKGIESIRKALTYKNKESKALAALFLIGLTKKGIIKEDLERLEEILIKISEEILAKAKWPVSSHGYSDHRALETIILAFEELKSKKAIPILERIAKHPEASYLDRNATEALKYLSEVEGQK